MKNAVRSGFFVPVYDAEVDAKLESTISSIADDLADTQQIVPLPLEQEEQKPDKTETETESSDDGEEQQIESDNKKLHKKHFCQGSVLESRLSCFWYF